MSDYQNVTYATTSTGAQQGGAVYTGYPATNGTYAQPVTVQSTQPSVVYATGQTAGYAYQPTVNVGIFDSNGRQKPVGEWGDNICDWPKNLYPSCYCSSLCLYGMYIFAQSKCLLIYCMLFFARDLRTSLIHFYSGRKDWLYDIP